MDKKFLKSVLEVPSYSNFEDKMIEFILNFCLKNDLQCDVKDKNVYITKGKVKKNEFYPCFTAHSDTVQYKQLPYVVYDEKIPLEETKNEDGCTIYTSPNIGIGGDDKCGIAIILDILLITPICKAVFFWGEEIGGKGSRHHVDLTFFEDVGWICGFDSPEFNRAAITCKGNRLFSKKFFKEYLKSLEIFGIDNWKHEPGTDVMILREKIDLQMMNFGSGYWNQHTEEEYVVYEEVYDAVSLGLYLIEILGLTKYPFKRKKPILSYLKWALKRAIRIWYKENFKK